MSTLESIQPGEETSISTTFNELAKRIIRRGLVIVISDLLDQPSEVLSALKHFRHRKHEVIVFHLLDKAEMTFPFEGPVVFRDMETDNTLSTQAEALKAGYLEQLNGFIQAYRRGCGASLIDYVQIDTATAVGLCTVVLSFTAKITEMSTMETILQPQHIEDSEQLEEVMSRPHAGGR